MSDNPMRDVTREFLQAIAGNLDEILNGREEPKKIGFALLVYPFSQEATEGTGRVNYIGNGKREDVLIAMKEIVARWEGRVPETDANGRAQ